MEQGLIEETFGYENNENVKYNISGITFQILDQGYNV
jgi:hypothetical protein